MTAGMACGSCLGCRTTHCLLLTPRGQGVVPGDAGGYWGAVPSLIRKGNAEGVGGNWEEDTEREEDVRERNDGTAI